MSDLDIFETGTTEGSNAQPVADTEEATQPDTATSTTNGTATSSKDVVAEVPAGAVTVAEFAATMTGRRFTEAQSAGRSFGPSDMVTPTAVYQKLKGTNALPHVMVQGEGDEKPVTYILQDEAIAAWSATATGTRGRGSSGNAEDEERLYRGVLDSQFHADARVALWTKRQAKEKNLAERRARWLADLGGDPQQVKADQYAKWSAEQDAKALSRKRTPDGTPEATA